MNVMRWDHSYSCTPVIADANWKSLATADNAQTHIALDNHSVGDPLTRHNTLLAVRQAGKGMVAVSAIHSYYTLTMVSSTAESIGENGTGVIDFQVMRGEKDGRPSVFGELINRTFRAFATNSAKHGIGVWQDLAKPETPPYPESPVTIDWTTQGPPPTWAHRVIPSTGWPRRYDELPDPAVQGEMKYWKMLIGPRTRYSSGSGSVTDYREAAVKAGYSAIAFAETFEELTQNKWESLLRDCRDNSDDNFVCLPGLNIESTEGQRYLVLGAERYPSPQWLTDDGKRLAAVRMLSLGWFGHVTVVHRPGKEALHFKTFKHFTGIGVATYDTQGRQIDDGWSLFKKDKGKPEENRTQFRMQVGVRSEDGTTPITSIKLYDEFDLVRNWQNETANFETIVAGTHNKQHCYILEATDAKGRRVLSPLMRTVSRNWRLALCG